MVGDILISNKHETKSIQLPTNTIDINNYVEFNHGAPSGFKQKIYIIRPNLCVALGGMVYQMKNFLEALIMFGNIHSDKIADKNFIGAFLHEFNCEENYSKSAFIMILLENITLEEGEVFQVSYPPNDSWKKVESEIFDSAIAWGSGANNFLNRITQKTKFESSHVKGNPYQAIQANLGLFARILAEEKVSLNTATKCWGAGFETILFNGKTLFKYPEITYVIWIGHYSKEGKLHHVFPHLIMHNQYIDEVLLIRSIEIKPGNIEIENDFMKFISTDIEINKFDVPRLDVPLEISKYKRPDDLSFKTNNVVLGYAFGTPHDICTPAYYNFTSAIEVEFQESENRIEIKILQEIHERMIYEGERVFDTLIY